MKDRSSHRDCIILEQLNPMFTGLCFIRHLVYLKQTYLSISIANYRLWKFGFAFFVADIGVVWFFADDKSSLCLLYFVVSVNANIAPIQCFNEIAWNQLGCHVLFCFRWDCFYGMVCF